MITHHVSSTKSIHVCGALFKLLSCSFRPYNIPLEYLIMTIKVKKHFKFDF